ncbi:hypothetical protein [Megasphaera massiliensis]|jgi:hypothetical protein|uniref:hypothetical protein n=1 Tax=Megasphaera massiliensis TaxID=1232428 RepID=UPI0005CA97AC|nr:hypothetical protein [Megasphaera massiliensis]MCQ5211143.1 hypothetical protein [Megasphaera massiliensis]DAF68424.1 MAG TPA: hypothetical protein [Caudoviricetes sp.]
MDTNQSLDIIDQLTMTTGLMKSVERNVFAGMDRDYAYGVVPMAATRTAIHNKIVILRGELLRLDQLVQSVDIYGGSSDAEE